MSDFRFAGRWLNDKRVMTLSGDDFKAFVTAGTWMVENRTDGVISRDDLEFIPRFPRPSIPRLVAAGLWVTHGPAAWLMVDYQTTQTSKAEFEVLANARRADREKKARYRQKQKSPGDVPGDMSRGTTQDRTGQEGKDISGSSQSDPVAFDWPVVTIPDDPGYCGHGITVGMKCRSCPGGRAELGRTA